MISLGSGSECVLSRLVLRTGYCDGDGNFGVIDLVRRTGKGRTLDRLGQNTRIPGDTKSADLKGPRLKLDCPHLLSSELTLLTQSVSGSLRTPYPPPMFLVLLFWPFYDSCGMARLHSRPVRCDEPISCSASFKSEETAHSS